MDIQMLKELKKKLDNNKQKIGQGSALQDILSTKLKNNTPIPKTFSPERKPINQKMNPSPDFHRPANANSISSKLTYVDLDSFGDFKDKFAKPRPKETANLQRALIMRSPRKNPSECGFKGNDSITSSGSKSPSKKEHSLFFEVPANISMGGYSKEKEEESNKVDLQEKSSSLSKKGGHKKTASFGCNPFNFLDSSTEENPRFKNHAKSDFFYENMKLFKIESAQKSLSIRYVTKTQKGFLITDAQKRNQDSFICVPNFGKNIHNHLFAICDGHGIYGHLVSNFLKEHLAESLLSSYQDFLKAPKESIYRAIAHIETVLEASFIDSTISGSTLNALLILDNSLISVNVGDSRCVLAKKNFHSPWKAVPLTIDHKPELPNESERIIKNGGVIEALKGKEGKAIGPLRVWRPEQNSCGIAMTRSIGDKSAKEVGVTWEPDIKEFKIEEDDKFIVLGSDGLWEVIGNEECVELVGKYYEKMELEGAAEELLEKTTSRWVNQDQRVIDDITFIIVFLSYF